MSRPRPVVHRSGGRPTVNSYFRRGSEPRWWPVSDPSETLSWLKRMRMDYSVFSHSPTFHSAPLYDCMYTRSMPRKPHMDGVWNSGTEA